MDGLAKMRREDDSAKRNRRGRSEMTEETEGEEARKPRARQEIGQRQEGKCDGGEGRRGEKVSQSSPSSVLNDLSFTSLPLIRDLDGEKRGDSSTFVLRLRFHSLPRRRRENTACSL